MVFLILLVALQFNCVVANPFITSFNKHPEEKTLRAEDIYNKASKCSITGKNDSAFYYTHKAYELATQEKDTVLIVKTLSLLAFTYYQTGDMDKSIETFEKAIHISEVLKDTLLIANTSELLSNVYSMSGATNLPRCLELLLKSAKLKEAKGAWEMLPGTYKNISTIFKQVGDTINRKAYLLKAIDMVDRSVVSNTTFKASVYNEAGRFYTDEDIDFEKAEYYYNKVLEISRKIDWKKGIAVSLTNIAMVKELQGNFQEALDLHSQSLEIKKSMNDLHGIANTYRSIADIYYKKKNYALSVKYLEEACKMAGENNLTGDLKFCYLSLYKNYKALNKYEPALGYYEKYTELADSLIGENHKKVIAELETRFETEKKEQTIEKLTVEKRVETLKARQRTLIAVSLAILMVVATVIFYLIYRQNKLKNERSESELKQKLLRSQMNPHFIFNALATIQNYIYNSTPDEAAKYLAKFSKLMRNILESSINEEIPVDQEIEIVNSYLMLEQIRDKNNFEFEVATEGVHPDDNIPPMLVQPFIENSIKHGFKDNETLGKIYVKYIFNDEKITIFIEDNGVGYLSTISGKDKTRKSYAIELTKQRLKLYHKKNKNIDSVEIKDLSVEGKNGTKVEINFMRY